jgi:hypothetical protein
MAILNGLLGAELWLSGAANLAKFARQVSIGSTSQTLPNDR